jgi:hypothetical protein
MSLSQDIWISAVVENGELYPDVFKMNTTTDEHLSMANEQETIMISFAAPREHTEFTGITEIRSVQMI